MESSHQDSLIHLKQHIQRQTQRPLTTVAFTILLVGVPLRIFLDEMESSAGAANADVWHTTFVATAFFLGVIVGLTSQVGRKRYAELMHRLPIEATTTLRYRVVRACSIGLPTWAVVSLFWILGRSFELWFSSLLISSIIFVLGLLTAACLLASLRGYDLEGARSAVMGLTIVMVAAAMFIPGFSWQFSGLAEALIIAASVALCVLVWKFALYLIRLNSLGLAEPPSGKPWWWPSFWHLGALYYLYALKVDDYSTLLILVFAPLHFAFQLAFNWIEYQFRDVNPPRAGLAFRALGNLCFLVATFGIVIWRLLQFWRQDVTSFVQEIEATLRPGVPIPWIPWAILAITAFVGFFMVFMTVDLMRTFRRRDTLLLRLPVLRSAIIKKRFNRWIHRMQWPLISLAVLDLVALWLIYPIEGEWRWLMALVLAQLIFLGLGFVFFRMDLPPRARV